MKKMLSQVSSVLQEWSDEYQEYRKTLYGYMTTSKLRRWLGHMEMPKHPKFHSRILYLDANNDAIIELRCYDGLSLAVAEGTKGYILDLQTGEKRLCLGATGKDITPALDNLLNTLADQIHDLAYPEYSVDDYHTDDIEYWKSLYL